MFLDRFFRLGYALKEKAQLFPATATRAELAIASRLPGKKEREFIEVNLGIPLHKFLDYQGYLECGHGKVWATARACRIIAATIMSAHFKIVQDGEVEVQIPRQAPDTVQFALGGFLRRPNPYDSWEDLVEMWLFHLELTGNAYWLKDEIDLKGRPTSLYPLLPHYMRVVPSATRKIDHYEYTVRGRVLSFQPEEIIHFRRSHPTNLHLGMGSIESAEGLFNSFINRGGLEEKFFENGAQPSGVLTREDATGDIDPGVWEMFKRKFSAEYAGKKNVGKVAFLNGKWSYHKLGLTAEEMQNLEREKWSVQQIFLNHGVPLTVAGLDTSASALARSKQDEINFRRFTAVPYIDSLVGKLNAEGFIQAAGGDTVELAYELSGLVDVEAVVRDYTLMLDRGVISRNEMRLLIGMTAVDDELMDERTVVAATTVPLGLIGGGVLEGDDGDGDDPGTGTAVGTGKRTALRRGKGTKTSGLHLLPLRVRAKGLPRFA